MLRSREAVLWLMCGCKFINRVLDMLGPGRKVGPHHIDLNCSERAATDEKVKHLLSVLHEIETALPEHDC